MPSIKDLLYDTFSDATIRAFPDLSAVPLEITQSTQPQFGHYQFNSAMRLAKELKQPPRAIAEQILSQIDAPFITKLEIAGPGFVNITVASPFLDQLLLKMFDDPHLGVEPPKNKQKIIVEFSSPNIAKELHVGHLRSTIIGDCIARVFEFLGHDVLRLNHIGDWGTQFGMLIAHMKEKAPEILQGKEETDLSHLVSWYKESKERFDKDAAFKERSQKEVVSLQGEDPNSLKAWNLLCEISRKAYEEIYTLLDIHLEERGESFYNPMLKNVVEDLQEKGLITVSDGAKCLFIEEYKNRDGKPMPLMLQKSDGGYSYDTTDMAALYHRTQIEKADRIVVVTDAGQALHFKLLEKGALRAGYLDANLVQFDHVTFGLVLGPDGKKFKTRSGTTEKLIDLLNTAVIRAKEVIETRSPAMEENEKTHLAHVLGIGAVKYADLSCHRTGDYTFSYDRMLRFEGNTAAFILYAYVRIGGIKRKIQADLDLVRKEHPIRLEHPSEIALGLHLAQFREVLDQITHDLLPNRLTDYLYALANTFNGFFRDCRVEGSEHQESRLLLIEVTARVMAEGLHILGLHTVQRM